MEKRQENTLSFSEESVSSAINGKEIEVRRPTAPATTPEAREDQIIAMAYDAVEQRIAAGIATGPELVHFLRAGSTEGRLKKELLKKEKELMIAKAETFNTQKRMEDLYARAIQAMRDYHTANEDIL